MPAPRAAEPTAVCQDPLPDNSPLCPETLSEEIFNQVSSDDAQQPGGPRAPTPHPGPAVGNAAVWFPEPGSQGWELRNSRSPGRGRGTQAERPTAPGTLAHSHLRHPHPQSPHHSQKTPWNFHLFKNRPFSLLPPFLAAGGLSQFKK